MGRHIQLTFCLTFEFLDLDSDYMDLPSRLHRLKGTDLNQSQRWCEKKLSTDDTDYVDFLREIEFRDLHSDLRIL